MIYMQVVGEIAAGAPVEICDESLATLSIGRTLIPNVRDFYCFRVNGQSMEPDIKHGDYVVVKKAVEWAGNENKVCAVNLDGEITLKLVIHDHTNKFMVLVSKNIDYDSIFVDPKYSKVKLVGGIGYCY